MSKRAEEAALKAYPKEDRKVWHSAFGTLEFDKNAEARKAYQGGYEQAEKDLALTWEDIPKLIELTGKTFRTFSDAGRQDVSLQQLYEEVLRIFNEQREKK